MDVIEELYTLYNLYNGKKQIIGYTENRLPVPCFFVGNGAPFLIFQYSIHAREYITSYLAFEQIKYTKRYLPKNVGTICFIPMVNIDGVKICLNGNKNYKANFNGVDLNVNFDADYGRGKQNLFYKNDSNFVGSCAFSENESKMLKDITLNLLPKLTVSYHSKGEEIYWYYGQKGKNLQRDFFIANYLSNITGYKLKYTFNSCGGYKDWCIKSLKIPSLTIEVGNDNLVHPIGKEYLWNIVKPNLTTPLRLTLLMKTLNL